MSKNGNFKLHRHSLMLTTLIGRMKVYVHNPQKHPCTRNKKEWQSGEVISDLTGKNARQQRYEYRHAKKKSESCPITALPYEANRGVYGAAKRKYDDRSIINLICDLGSSDYQS